MIDSVELRLNGSSGTREWQLIQACVNPPQSPKVNQFPLSFGVNRTQSSRIVNPLSLGTETITQYQPPDHLAAPPVCEVLGNACFEGPRPLITDCRFGARSTCNLTLRESVRKSTWTQKNRLYTPRQPTAPSHKTGLPGKASTPSRPVGHSDEMASTHRTGPPGLAVGILGRSSI